MYTLPKRKPGEMPFYKFNGDGSPLLMIHGYMVSGEMYYPLIDSYLDRYETIVPDLRGYGQNRNMPGPYTTRQHAEDMIAILDEMGIEKAHVMGYSMGGTIAQYLSLHFPNRVKSLILACTFAHKPATALERWQKGVIKTLLARLGAKGVMRFVTSQFGDLAGNDIEPKTAVWLRRMLSDNNDEVLLHSLEEIYNVDFRPQLKKITHPTFVIGAGSDIVVPVHHLQMLAQGIPDAKIKVIQNTGHGLIHTHIKEYVSVTRVFLDEIDAKLS